MERERNMPLEHHVRGPVSVLSVLAGAALALAVAGCSPRVEVVAPDKPITINLNVKIDHEVRVKIDRELDEVFSAESDLF